MERALFLDRDGVINVDYGYVGRREEFSFIDGIFDLARAANRLGWLVIVVTNQSGIGRGYFSEKDFEQLTFWMKSRFLNEGCEISKVYWCPFHPVKGVGKYRAESCCRKPNPGMIFQACKDFSIDPEKSILVGDKICDIIAGKKAGIGLNIHFNMLDEPPIDLADRSVLSHSQTIECLEEFTMQCAVN